MCTYFYTASCLCGFCLIKINGGKQFMSCTTFLLTTILHLKVSYWVERPQLNAAPIPTLVLSFQPVVPHAGFMWLALSLQCASSRAGFVDCAGSCVLLFFFVFTCWCVLALLFPSSILKFRMQARERQRYQLTWRQLSRLVLGDTSPFFLRLFVDCATA